MQISLHPSTLTLVVHAVLVVAIFVRVVMMRPLPGVALAWLMLVALIPLLGALLYLSFGERRVRRTQAQRIASQRQAYETWLGKLAEAGSLDVDWSRHPPTCERMSRLGMAAIGIPTVIGSDLALITDTEEILRSIIADIDKATSSVHMAFYLWHGGGTADEVADAVLRAHERGVRCRILVDDLGSRKWFRRKVARRLRAAGVEMHRALPAGPLHTIVARGDLRLHRKIVVVDGVTAYTGSMNLVDPRFFKLTAGVGRWIDAMVRVKGPAVEPLRSIFLSDWQRETGETIEALIASADALRLAPEGSADVQVIPSGPGEGEVPDGLLQMLMKMIYAAREEVIITTPYFVPDDSMLRALRTAAGHGVRVELIVPAKVDSILVRYASRSYFDDLMQVGVNIRQFEGGLLHTKSITVDGRISMFGTVNLDMRSLWLNYEVSLFVYDEDFTGRLRALQFAYLEDCSLVERDAWLARPGRTRFVENVARLVSPLL